MRERKKYFVEQGKFFYPPHRMYNVEIIMKQELSDMIDDGVHLETHMTQYLGSVTRSSRSIEVARQFFFGTFQDFWYLNKIVKPL